MIALMLGLVGLIGSPPSEITPLEAVAAARWFCRCVDVKTSLDLVSVVKRQGNSNEDSYLVQLGANGSTSMTLYVDPVSGDVFHAYTWPFPKDGQYVTSPLTDTWLKRLGREKGVVPNAGREYVGIVNGHRFLNLNGSSKTMFQVENGHFAWFLAHGALPPLPGGKASISKSKAEALAKAQRDARVNGSLMVNEIRSELGMFYDDERKATRWVWKVTPGHMVNGEFSANQSDFIDAQTGAVVSDNRYQSSSFAYRSREPRKGLASVKARDLDIPLVKLAERRLSEIGRSDVRFESIEVKTGIRMYNRNDAQLELGADGYLISFTAPTKGSPLNAAEMLEKGKKIVLSQHRPLPEGKFMVTRSDRDYTHVIYRQEALGYPYLDREVVAINFGAGGVVARFDSAPAAPRPTALPSKTLSPADIENLAMALAKPHVQKDTEKIRYSASAKVGELGWYIPRSGGNPTLAYVVRVMFMREIKDWATQGGGSSYHFDAVTGRCLDKFP